VHQLLPPAARLLPIMQLELYSSGGGGLSPSWQPRQQVMLQQVVDPAHLQQYMKFSAAQQAAGNKITRVHYRVMQHGPSWHWLQVSIAQPTKMSGMLIGQVSASQQSVNELCLLL
jgi:hypothetical protein